MLSLAFDLPTTAEMLATDSQHLQNFIERDQPKGVLRLGDSDWRVSLFTLARWLDTTPEQLLNLLEDLTFGELLEEADEEEALGFEDGMTYYQQQLATQSA